LSDGAAPSAVIEGPRRTLITASIMLSSLMQSLDNTIANVALPHIQGSVSATQDQISWVLTSYIIAVAIMTPLSGWLAGKIGRKRVFLFSVAGFTVASMLCGLAQSLSQIVLARVLQGICGAALVPLSQATRSRWPWSDHTPREARCRLHAPDTPPRAVIGRRYEERAAIGSNRSRRRGALLVFAARQKALGPEGERGRWFETASPQQ
jgi:hypothetical protein